MFTHGDKKQSTNQRMGKYDPETAQAWALIMKKIQLLRAEGHTLASIGKLMHVGRAAVSRWLSEDIGGEKTTYGDMLRYAKALGISREEFLGKPSQKPLVTPYDKAVGRVLEEFTMDSDLTITDLAKLAGLEPITVNAIFTGTVAASPNSLFKMCSALEVSANLVLKRAARRTENPEDDIA